MLYFPVKSPPERMRERLSHSPPPSAAGGCTQVLRLLLQRRRCPLSYVPPVCAPLLSCRGAARLRMALCSFAFVWAAVSSGTGAAPSFVTAASLHSCVLCSCPVYALLGCGLFHCTPVRVLLRSCVLRPSLCDALLRSGLLRSCPLVAAAAVLRIAPRRGAQHPPLGSASKEARSLQSVGGCT